MNKSFIISAIIVLLTLSLLLGFYFVSKLETKTITKEIIRKIPNENCPDKEPVDFDSRGEFNLEMNSDFDFFLNCAAYKCTATVENFGKIVSLKNYDDWDTNTFIINGKVVNSNSYPTAIKFLNNNVFVKFKTGGDISGTSFGVYDKNGKEIVYYSLIGDSINNIPDLFGNYIRNEIEVSDSKIIFEVTTLGHGEYIGSDEDASICDKNEWSKLKDGANTVVTKSYTLNYLGNSKYSSPIIKNVETLQNVHDKYVSQGSCE